MSQQVFAYLKQGLLLLFNCWQWFINKSAMARTKGGDIGSNSSESLQFSRHSYVMLD